MLHFTAYFAAFYEGFAPKFWVGGAVFCQILASFHLVFTVC
jgi:hypothetical protein